MSITKKAIKRQYTIEPGLVLWLPFDGDVRDYSGNSNHGLNYGASWVAGKIGNALQFDGINDNIITSPIDLTPYNTGTLSFWIKPTSVIGYDLFGWHKSGGYSDYTNIILDAGKIKFFITNGAEQILASDDILNVGNWYHVVVTQTGSLITMHINTILQSQTITTSVWWDDMTFVDQSFYIGKLFNAAWLDGIIDEPRVYNRALNPNEVWDLYQSGL